MRMTGAELIQWIEDNQLEDSHIYKQVNENGLVKSVSRKEIIIDECGDILICNPEN